MSQYASFYCIWICYKQFVQFTVGRVFKYIYLFNLSEALNGTLKYLITLTLGLQVTANSKFNPSAYDFVGFMKK